MNKLSIHNWCLSNTASSQWRQHGQTMCFHGFRRTLFVGGGGFRILSIYIYQFNSNDFQNPFSFTITKFQRKKSIDPVLILTPAPPILILCEGMIGRTNGVVKLFSLWKIGFSWEKQTSGTIRNCSQFTSVLPFFAPTESVLYREWPRLLWMEEREYDLPLGNPTTHSHANEWTTVLYLNQNFQNSNLLHCEGK